MAYSWQVPDRFANERDKIGWLTRILEIPMGFCQCGCGQKTEIADRTRAERGQVKGKPNKFVWGHNPVQQEDDKESRFWLKWKFAPSMLDTPCWEWKGAVYGESGYGVSGRIRGEKTAHRIAYLLSAGNIIPEGYEVDHLCRNRLCINPLHLEPVTKVENIRRSTTAKISLERAREIRTSGMTDRALAEVYGIHHSTVNAIRTGRTWREDAC